MADKHLDTALVNAGDGRSAHPTQGLLDMLTLRQACGVERDLGVGVGEDHEVVLGAMTLDEVQAVARTALRGGSHGSQPTGKARRRCAALGRADRVRRRRATAPGDRDGTTSAADGHNAGCR